MAPGFRHIISRLPRVRRWLGLLPALLLAFLIAPAADAITLSIDHPFCHAVTTGRVPAAFACAGAPAGYDRSTLWLRAAMPAEQAVGRDAVFLIAHTRFDRMIVQFGYADGHTEQRTVRRGDYGPYWTTGGQLAFPVPARAAGLATITLRFDRLTSHTLLHMRILPAVAANRDMAITGLLAGGSITLLLAGALYNLSIAVTGQRGFLAWHSVWAMCMVLWGLIWSQAVLILFPGFAGTASGQICTALAGLAIAAATISAVSALRGIIHPWALRSVLMLAAAVTVLSLAAALITSAAITAIGSLLGLLVLTDLVAIAGCISWGCWRGSGDARDLAKSWGLPMAILALTILVDVDDRMFGGGSYIAILIASALQTIWLAITITRRLAAMRVELEAAREAEIALQELASRDPMTGLLNRRGFVERIEQTFAGGNEAPLALLLLDVDHFKLINDAHGHEVGDDVLCRIAQYLHKLERELCVSGRMGGEEFVLAVSGLTAFQLEQFADRVRAEIGACDHGVVTKDRRVSVSIGVAEGTTRTPFQRLYSNADRALYDAKKSGRNKVVFHLDDGESREALERDQLTFDWTKSNRRRRPA